MDKKTLILISVSVVLVSMLVGAFIGKHYIFDNSLKFNLTDNTSVSVDATQRVILVSKNGGPNRDRQIACAEPSPDVMSALTRELSATSKFNESVGVGISGALGRAVENIGKRNATIQLLRDGTFRACEAFLNGAINELEYSLVLNHYDRVMITLLSIEQIIGAITAASSSANDAAMPSTENVALKILDFLGSLSKDPRLVVSCLSWFSRTDMNFDPSLSPKDSSLQRYCDSTLASYEGYVSHLASQAAAQVREQENSKK